MTTARKNSPVGETREADEWVSLPKAAELLGVHRQKVLQLALKGRLDAEHRGEWTFISRESIERYLTTMKHSAPAANG